jgi:hypothetical protein
MTATSNKSRTNRMEKERKREKKNAALPWLAIG